MSYKICKSIELESGHLLSKHPGNCQFPHGHTRSVEFVFSADTLDEADMVMDFKAVKEMIGEFLDTFDHGLCVNTADPMFETFRNVYGERIIPFENRDPTSEVIAYTIFQRTKTSLQHAKAGRITWPVRACVSLVSVRVWETSSSWAEYSE